MIVDRNGYPIRVGQTCIACYGDSANMGRGKILRIQSSEKDLVYGCWVKWENSNEERNLLAMNLEVIAPQPLEWVRFTTRRPTRQDADIARDVYHRFFLDGCGWLYTFYSVSLMNKVYESSEWLSGLVDHVEFFRRKPGKESTEELRDERFLQV